MERCIIIRHGQPGKFDEALFGTVCKVPHIAAKNYDIYIQVNKENLSSWEFIDTFPENIPQEEIEHIVSNRLKM